MILTTPPNIYKEPLLITHQEILPVPFEPERIKIVRVIIPPQSDLHCLSDHIARFNVYPLSLTELVALVDHIRSLNSLIDSGKLQAKGKKAKALWESKNNQHKSRLASIYTRLNYIVLQDGAVIPNYSKSALFCGTELCDPHPELSSLRYYPTIGCRLQEAEYTGIGKEWIHDFHRLDIACMEK